MNYLIRWLMLPVVILAIVVIAVIDLFYQVGSFLTDKLLESENDEL